MAATYYEIARLAILSLICVLFIMSFFRRGTNKFVVKGKMVLLTGASEGMGKQAAIQLAQKGASIIIVSRNIAKLEAALAEIKASAISSSQSFHYISADLCDQSSAARVVEEATALNNNQAPDIVWCIAGAAIPGFFIDTPLSVLRSQMESNFWSCADMAHATLPIWLSPTAAKSEHHFVFTSSVVAFFSVAGYSPYGPAKAAIKSLSDSLAQEMLLYGEHIKIHTVFPGTISSPGLILEDQTKPEITSILEESDPVQTPDTVARKAIEGLERGEYLVTVGWLGTLMRGTAWGGSNKNGWVFDTVLVWVASLVAPFVALDLNGKVRKYAREKGHPSTYVARGSK